MRDAGTRVIVVLGYSEPAHQGLHPVCAQRLAHAASVSTPQDVVVLSGWSRVHGGPSEAQLMADVWRGSARELVVDPDATTTVENARNALDDVVRSGAQQVVVVTSRWHARRAATVFRHQLRRTGASIAWEAPPGGSVTDWMREIPRWFVLPFQLTLGWPKRRPSRHDPTGSGEEPSSDTP